MLVLYSTNDISDQELTRLYIDCKAPSKAACSVVKMFIVSDYRSAKTVQITLPAAAKTAATVLTWEQDQNKIYKSRYLFSRILSDWAIDRVRVTNRNVQVMFEEDFNPIPVIP